MNEKPAAFFLGLGFLGLALALPASLCAPDRAWKIGDWQSRLPVVEPDPTLPPLPETSPRIASYSIDARLDPERHEIEGTAVLEWRNTTDQHLASFPFHLYWNAFRNNLSSSARGEGRRAARAPGSDDERAFGFTQVRSIALLGAQEADLTPTLRYVQPDDGNADDRSVIEVQTPAPIAPGETARFRIDWTSRIPHGAVGRSGWVHDYHFIAQWFPKIGVHWKGKWNCHQFHSTTEFFADYGNYDVRLTLPAGHVVGATGRLSGRTTNADGSETFRFVQEDVHDFAWVTSRRLLERTARFEAPGYPPVEIRLLLQPEHAQLAERYLEATRIALRTYGAWSAPYPYAQITVVDPAWSSASGGMEYPTLFTGGASLWAPAALHSPEGVTIHEAGHQFWYGLVGNNEFEEAWLDEGFDSYHDEKSTMLALGPRAWGRRYFGVQRGRRMRGGIPVVAPDVWIARNQGDIEDLRRHGQTDVMARRAWEYLTPRSYGLNSYGKPALTLLTLERLVGDETMTRILRTYARRFRFAHPTTADFIATVEEVTGKDYRWFFDETWFSSELCDYAVSVENRPASAPRGFFEAPDGRIELVSRGEPPSEWSYESVVTLRRLGGVRMPVELLVEFTDGHEVREQWDGRDRWKRFVYERPAEVRLALVDPEGKLAIDIRRSNNSWTKDVGAARRAATKWAARWMLWLQSLLELHMLVG